MLSIPHISDPGQRELPFVNFPAPLDGEEQVSCPSCRETTIGLVCEFCGWFPTVKVLR